MMDRLTEIDHQYRSGQWGADDEAYDDIQWLIAEVKRLRDLLSYYIPKDAAEYGHDEEEQERRLREALFPTRPSA